MLSLVGVVVQRFGEGFILQGKVAVVSPYFLALLGKNYDNAL